MTTVAIHQPEYFPWLGYLDKIRRADVFVVLDSVQFDRSSLQQRTRVAGSGGAVWMSIPFVHRFPQRIDEVEIADDSWRVKHRKTLQACYGRARGYPAAAARLDDFFQRAYARVVDAALASIELLVDSFGLRGRSSIRRASELPTSGAKGDLVLEICSHLGATRYLSGRTGAAYLDHERFRARGIEIEVQSFALPPYERPRPLGPDELKGLSALDAWLHAGEGAAALLEPPR
jgi:hypothetical protein